MFCLQAGSLDGLCLREGPCPTTILKKMLGKDARAALKYQSVRYKVGRYRLPLNGNGYNETIIN